MMCLEGLLRSLIPFRNFVTKLRRGWHDFPASHGDSSVLNTARTEAAGTGNELVSSVCVILPHHSSQLLYIV